MTAKRRLRRLHSVKGELLKKSREAAIAGVQIFNSPAITFKSETYIVLMIIAWTYLLHAYYRTKKIEYRHRKQAGGRRPFDRTKSGAYKYWELERCLDCEECPLSREVKQNLKFLIGLRHEIEHQMTTRIDDVMGTRFQACCINYHDSIISLFGDDVGIAKHLSFSLQFASLGPDQVDAIDSHKSMPPHIKRYVKGFDGPLTSADLQHPRYKYGVIFLPVLVNHENQAHSVVKFIKSDSALAQHVGPHHIVVKEVEKAKLLPSAIVRQMHADGFLWFTMHHHTQFSKSMDAKNPAKGYAVLIASTWYWYDSWVNEVRKYCKSSGPAPSKLVSAPPKTGKKG